MLGNFVCFFWFILWSNGFCFFLLFYLGLKVKSVTWCYLRRKNLNWHYTNTCIMRVKTYLFPLSGFTFRFIEKMVPKWQILITLMSFFIHFPHSRHTVLATIFIAIMIIKENSLTHTHSRTFFTHGDFCSDGFYIMHIHQTIYTVYLEIHYNVYVRYFSLNKKAKKKQQHTKVTWKKIGCEKEKPCKNFQGEIKHFLFLFTFSGILFTVSFFFFHFKCVHYISLYTHFLLSFHSTYILHDV